MRAVISVYGPNGRDSGKKLYKTMSEYTDFIMRAKERGYKVVTAQIEGDLETLYLLNDSYTCNEFIINFEA